MRARKEGNFVNIKLKRDLATRLSSYTDRTGYTKTAVIENALQAYLDKEAHKNDEQSKGDA